jgi:hypothetical protein
MKYYLPLLRLIGLQSHFAIFAQRTAQLRSSSSLSLPHPLPGLPPPPLEAAIEVAASKYPANSKAATLNKLVCLTSSSSLPNSSSKPSIYHYSITVDGEQLEVDIPDMVKSVFDEEFGSLDEEVKQTNLFKVAALLFAGYLDAATSMAASSGGGGSPGSGWGKDKDDDERNWAVRCAKMAKWLCKPIKRSRGR